MTDRVLFVDDESNVLSAFRRSFRGTFDMDTVSNAVDAMARVVGGERYAVVVSDLNMPGVNGIQLLREFQKRAPSTVRMMLTGNADVSAATAAVEMGEIHRYLTKPCSAERLARAVREAIDHHRVSTLTVAPKPATAPPGAYEVHLADMKIGDILAAPVFSSDGTLLLNGGERITRDILDRLGNHHRLKPLRQPFHVFRVVMS